MSDFDKDDKLIDPTKMTQREMLLHVYRTVGKIELTIVEDRAEIESRLNKLENSDSTQRGIRIGLSLAATILSIVAVWFSSQN